MSFSILSNDQAIDASSDIEEHVPELGKRLYQSPLLFITFLRPSACGG